MDPFPSGESVTSYRVRDHDDERCVIEAYTMRLADERLTYLEPNPGGYIYYRSYLGRRRRFQEHIRQMCAASGYPYGDPEHTGAFNLFLATHYFPRGTYAGPAREIRELNALAAQYMNAYNASLNQPDDTDIGSRLSAARSILREGIGRVECVNVGQANFSIGYGKVSQKPLACFDVGVRSSTRAWNCRNYAVRKMGALDGDGVVVISHYDFDHINGYRFLSGAAADRIWFLPERRPSPTPPERRLLAQLRPDRCVFLKDADYAQTPFDPARHTLRVGNITIYQGNAKKKDPFQSTAENARCLICLVQDQRSMLLPGDCLYEEFPTSFSVDYLAVPHHCCYYGAPVKNLNAARLRELIVFAGPNNQYKHPDVSHLRNLASPLCQSVVCLMNHNRFCFSGKQKRAPSPLPPVRIPSYDVFLS